MKIVFCPVRQLPAVSHGRCAAVISSSVPLDPCRIPTMPYIFRCYEDLDAPVPGRSFQEADARAFAAFVRGLEGTVDVICCCCDAAKSRSPAVAAALCRYFGLSDAHIWADPSVSPNMLVFDLLTRALGIPVSDEEKDALFYKNRQAFQKAIRATL